MSFAPGFGVQVITYDRFMLCYYVSIPFVNLQFANVSGFAVTAKIVPPSYLKLDASFLGMRDIGNIIRFTGKPVDVKAGPTRIFPNMVTLLGAIIQADPKVFVTIIQYWNNTTPFRYNTSNCILKMDTFRSSTRRDYSLRPSDISNIYIHQ